VLALGNFLAKGRLEVVASHDVVDIVDSSRSHSDLGEIHRPHSAVGILGLILRKVRRIDMVMDVST
jgi:hypothetical protein